MLAPFFFFQQTTTFLQILPILVVTLRRWKVLTLGVLKLWPMAEKYTAGAGQRAISHLPGVDSHPNRIHLKRVFASKFDPRVDAYRRLKEQEGNGVIDVATGRVGC